MIGINNLDKPISVTYERFESLANMCVPLALRVETSKVCPTSRLVPSHQPYTCLCLCYVATFFPGAACPDLPDWLTSCSFSCCGPNHLHNLPTYLLVSPLTPLFLFSLLVYFCHLQLPLPLYSFARLQIKMNSRCVTCLLQIKMLQIKMNARCVTYLMKMKVTDKSVWMQDAWLICARWKWLTNQDECKMRDIFLAPLCTFQREAMGSIALLLKWQERIHCCLHVGQLYWGCLLRSKHFASRPHFASRLMWHMCSTRSAEDW